MPYEWMPLSQMDGVHIDIPELPRHVPLRTTKDYDDFLARLAAYPRQVEEVVELMKRADGRWLDTAGCADQEGSAADREAVGRRRHQKPTLQAIREFPRRDRRGRRRGSPTERREAITGSIIPAFKRLHQFIAQTYLPACRQDIAASRLPGGPAYYEAQVRWLTTTDLSPREIHEVGRREVTRIRKAMDDVIHQAGFSGTIPEFVKLLRTDPRFAPVPTDEVLPAFRDIAKP